MATSWFWAGTVRLEPGTTKNDEAHMLPFAMLPELANMLRNEWNATQIENWNNNSVGISACKRSKTSMEPGKQRVRRPEYRNAFHTTSEGQWFGAWNGRGASNLNCPQSVQPLEMVPETGIEPVRAL